MGSRRMVMANQANPKDMDNPVDMEHHKQVLQEAMEYHLVAMLGELLVMEPLLLDIMPQVIVI